MSRNSMDAEAGNQSVQPGGVGIKPLASVLAHRRLALWSFVLVLLLGTPLAWIKGAPRFQATATVQVAPRYMKNVKDDSELEFQSNSQYRQFVEHQVRSVARFDIVRDALLTLGPRAASLRRAGESERRTVERLQERLLVAAVPDTYLFQVSIAASQRDALAEVVNAVVAAYLKRMQQEQMYGADERVRNIAQRETELARQVADKSVRRTAIALEIGVATFSEGDVNPYDKLLLATRLALAEARNVRLAAAAKQAAFLQQGETDLTVRSINESVLSDPGLNSLKVSLNNRRALIVTQNTGLTAQHPAYAAARQELAEIDQAIRTQAAALVGEVSKSLRARYAMTFEQARRYEDSLALELAEQERASARYAALYNDAKLLGSDIAQANKEIDSLRERQNFFTAERSALGFVRLVTPAQEPELPFGPGRKKMLLIVLALAGAAALALPIARDLMDGRVRSVNEVERALGLPSMGWMIEHNGIASTMFAQDQLRRIAGALVREQDKHGTRVFALCGVKAGGGTSDLTLKLAKVLGELGFSTLALEANAFRPDPRYGGATAGLVQCLAGTRTPAECVIPAYAALPARIGVGSTGMHIDRLDRLADTVAACPPEYRFVLVDLPSLLLSADAEIMISRLGQVLLVVEAGAVTRGELGRTARLLAKCGSTAVGVIVNRIRPIDGGGYIGKLMIEYLTQRKFSQFQSQPAWRLTAQRIGMHVRAMASLRGMFRGRAR